MSLFWLETGLVSSLVLGFLTWLTLCLATDSFDEFLPALCGFGVFVLVSLLTLMLNVGTLEFGLIASAIVGLFAWFLLAGSVDSFDEAWPGVTGVAVFIFGAIVTLGETIGWTWVIVGVGLAGAVAVGLYILSYVLGDQFHALYPIATPGGSTLHGTVPPIATKPIPSSSGVGVGSVVINVHPASSPPPPPSVIHCTHCGSITDPRTLSGVLRCPACGGLL